MSEVKLHPVDDFLEKFPHTLSGGQQQRIVIARAMLREPKLIVADEPVSMLDASVRVEILKLMRALQELHGLSVIYITHDLSTVKYFSKRIFVMYAGNLIEKADTRQLLDNPLHPYTHALLAATSDPDANNAENVQGSAAGRAAESGQSADRLSLPSALSALYGGTMRREVPARLSSPSPDIMWPAGYIRIVQWASETSCTSFLWR